VVVSRLIFLVLSFPTFRSAREVTCAVVKHFDDRFCCFDVQVTGNANEDQVLKSIETYVDVVEFLVQSLNELFRITKENVCVNQRRALDVR